VIVMTAGPQLLVLAQTRHGDVFDLVARNWAIWLPVVLGLIAVYLLLPRARGYPPLYGAAAAGLALLTAGLWLVNLESSLAESILFYIFAGLAIVFGTLMITQRNPVHAALSFAMVVLSTCGLFLLLAAPFLMAATIIIYAGAIVVTFLFVIMLAQQAGLSSADQRSREPFLSAVAGFILLGSLLYVLIHSYTSNIDGYLEQARRASQASSVADWQGILGSSFFDDFARAIEPGEGLRQPGDARGSAKKLLAAKLLDTGVNWQKLRPGPDGKPRDTPETVAQFKADLAEIYRLAEIVRQGQGTVQPVASPLSPFSGQASGMPVSRDDKGQLKERLPAANVAGLGKTLFTDYLLAVELAGTLLLVATIGAIAIAARREEGLR
jgi:NADH:ubiquinone oxidoreductase subunit 6 (subunit J)